MTIWKYSLKVTDEQTIEMPEGDQLLCVQIQGFGPHVWALVNPNASLKPRKFSTYGTGNPVDNASKRYVGTYQLHDGEIVFHVFERL